MATPVAARKGDAKQEGGQDENRQVVIQRVPSVPHQLRPLQPRMKKLEHAQRGERGGKGREPPTVQRDRN